jgi:hypothetical protein
MNTIRCETLGNVLLCAWPVAHGLYWVQTRSPELAKRLAKRGDSKPVVKGVLGGYLRTFELPIERRSLVRLLDRYTSELRATGSRFWGHFLPQERFCLKAGMPTRGNAI